MCLLINTVTVQLLPSRQPAENRDAKIEVCLQTRLVHSDEEVRGKKHQNKLSITE